MVEKIELKDFESGRQKVFLRWSGEISRDRLSEGVEKQRSFTVETNHARK